MSFGAIRKTAMFELLIEPMWNWNIEIQPVISISIFAFNWTNVELK